jgi:hypothetical protein
VSDDSFVRSVQFEEKIPSLFRYTRKRKHFYDLSVLDFKGLFYASLWPALAKGKKESPGIWWIESKMYPKQRTMYTKTRTLYYSQFLMPLLLLIYGGKIAQYPMPAAILAVYPQHREYTYILMKKTTACFERVLQKNIKQGNG